MTNNKRVIPPPTTSSTPRQQSIDFAKLLAAFLVVWLHYGPLSHDTVTAKATTYFLNSVCRLAVPFFFITTGYFYLDIRNRGQIKLYLAKLIKLSLGATLIYFALLSYKSSVYYTITGIHLSHIVNFLLFNDPIWVLGYHLWYLFALIYAIAIIDFYDSHFHKTDKLYYATAILLVIGVALQCVQMSAFYTRNFLIFALPYIVAGRFIREYQHRIQLPFNITLTIAIICAVSIFIEIFTFSTDGAFWKRDNYPLLLPASMAIFLLLINLKSPSALLSKLGRKYSGLTYIVHVAVAEVLIDIMEIHVNNYLMPFIIFIISLITVIIYSRIKRALTNVSRQTFNRLRNFT